MKLAQHFSLHCVREIIRAVIDVTSKLSPEEGRRRLQVTTTRELSSGREIQSQNHRNFVRAAIIFGQFLQALVNDNFFKYLTKFTELCLVCVALWGQQSNKLTRKTIF